MRYERDLGADAVDEHTHIHTYIHTHIYIHTYTYMHKYGGDLGPD